MSSLQVASYSQVRAKGGDGDIVLKRQGFSVTFVPNS